MTNKLYDSLFEKHKNNKNCFLQLNDGTEISYQTFLQTAGRIANLFSDLGLKANDRVAVQIAKSPEALAIYAACIRAGLVFLPLNNAYTPNEIAYFIDNSNASLLICQDISKQDLAPIALKNKTMLETLNADGSGSLPSKYRLKPCEFETVERSGDDLAAFLYTSGTTGRSKGAMLTQDNLLSNANTLVKYWQFSEDDILLHTLPIFHTHGLFVATNIILAAGAKMIFLPKFDLDMVINQLPNATCMMGVPTFYTRLLADARFDKPLAQHMRLFISGSAPLLEETHVMFEQRTGHRILERYGMTETNMNSSNPFDGARKAGTVGMALPGIEIKITDAKSGATLPNGEIGVLEVRGPNVFKGYWQMPEKTAEELRDNGFFITGDLAQMDEEGYITIVGRNKDMIIAGGFNIYPKEGKRSHLTPLILLSFLLF
ncbi:MAG: AMP-binding protein [Rhizobiales bacterium]|nr:AMP-binding protein [Hyphomicrobiales bacterium]